MPVDASGVPLPDPVPSVSTRFARVIGLDSASFFAVLTRLVLAAGHIVTVTLIATFISPEAQGYYFTFLNLVALQSFLELGFYLVIVNVAAHEWSLLGFDADGHVTGDPAARGRLASLARLTLRWYGLVTLVFLPIVGGIGYAVLVSENSGTVAWKGPWSACVVGALFALWANGILSFLEGCNQVTTAFKIRVAGTLLGQIATWITLWLGGGLWAAPLLLGLGALTQLTILGLRFQPFLRTLMTTLPKPSLNWRFDVWPLQWRIAVQGMASFFFFALFVPVSFNQYGAVVAGQVGLSWAMANTALSLTTAWLQSQAPGLAILAARRQWQALNEKFIRIALASTVMLAALLSILWVTLTFIKSEGFSIATRYMDPESLASFFAAAVLLQVSTCMSVYLRAHKKDPSVYASTTSGILVGLTVWLAAHYLSPDAIPAAFLLVVAFVLIPWMTVVFTNSAARWHATEGTDQKIATPEVTSPLVVTDPAFVTDSGHALGTTAQESSGFHFIVPVWGEIYTRLFCEIALPSHLAPGNLPALTHPTKCLYHIVTHAADKQQIESSPAYQRLTALLPTRIDLVEGPILNVHTTMSECYRRGIESADDHDAASVFLTPDIIFADGAFARMETIAASGKRVIEMPVVRLDKGAVVPHLRSLFLSIDMDQLIAPPRALMTLAMKHLHPIAFSHFFEGNAQSLIPANLFWWVPGDEGHMQGILAHCFHLHPLMVWPRRKHMNFAGTVDDDYVKLACPDMSDTYIVSDSDEILAFEMSDHSREVKSDFLQGSISDIANWAEYGTNSRHRILVPIPLRLKAEVSNETAWSATEASASLVIRDILARLKRTPFKLAITQPFVLLRRALRHMRETVAHKDLGISALLGESCEPISIALFRVVLALHRLYVTIGVPFERLWWQWLVNLLRRPPQSAGFLNAWWLYEVETSLVLAACSMATQPHPTVWRATAGSSVSELAQLAKPIAQGGTLIAEAMVEPSMFDTSLAFDLTLPDAAAVEATLTSAGLTVMKRVAIGRIGTRLAFAFARAVWRWQKRGRWPIIVRIATAPLLFPSLIVSLTALNLTGAILNRISSTTMSKCGLVIVAARSPA